MHTSMRTFYFIFLFSVTLLAHTHVVKSLHQNQDDHHNHLEDIETDELEHYDIDSSYDESEDFSSARSEDEFLQDSSLDESDRLEEYYNRNYTWPLETFLPDTKGWRKILQRRFEQIQRIEDLGERYEAWVMVMGAALVIPNFTESG